MNLFGLFQRGSERATRMRAASERLAQYNRYLRSYQGYSVRGALNTNVVRDWKRVKFNFIQPVVNLSAGWFAAKALDWAIDDDPEATKAAYDIWDRSGSEGALLENAILCGIYGDVVGLATQDDQERPRIEFVDPSICTPEFDGSDYSNLIGLEIAYEASLPGGPGGQGGQVVTRREMYGPQGMEAYLDTQLVDSRAYEELPACWIRNSGIKGLPYGLSDVEPILDLVEEYDHVASKQTRIIDYYATPNIVFTKVLKGAAAFEKGVGTIFYLPEGATASFLEWSGDGPNVEEQLTRIRNGIAEISQVPAVAFGQADSGHSSISGVAIKILYGPLINKTKRKQASWGPSLQFLMWQCLKAAGYKALPLEAVNVNFPDATPADGTEVSARNSARIASRVASRKTIMTEDGIEEPDKELLRIIVEEKMLQLSAPAAAVEGDANQAATAGARGRFVAEAVGGGAGAGGGGGATGGTAPPSVADQVAEITAWGERVAKELEALSAMASGSGS